MSKVLFPIYLAMWIIEWTVKMLYLTTCIHTHTESRNASNTVLKFGSFLHHMFENFPSGKLTTSEAGIQLTNS